MVNICVLILTLYNNRTPELCARGVAEKIVVGGSRLRIFL